MWHVELRLLLAGSSALAQFLFSFSFLSFFFFALSYLSSFTSASTFHFSLFFFYFLFSSSFFLLFFFLHPPLHPFPLYSFQWADLSALAQAKPPALVGFSPTARASWSVVTNVVVVTGEQLVSYLLSNGLTLIIALLSGPGPLKIWRSDKRQVI